MKTKMKGLLSLALALLLLSGCAASTQEEINIIDDDYRNWYEIFVYSFCDSNGDGIGDLNGVTEKLDYVAVTVAERIYEDLIPVAVVVVDNVYLLLCGSCAAG